MPLSEPTTVLTAAAAAGKPAATSVGIFDNLGIALAVIIVALAFVRPRIQGASP
jgi:hypothetical protein